MMSSAAAICSASAQVSIANRTASRWMTSASTREAAAVPSSERRGWRGSSSLQTEWEGAGGLMDMRVGQAHCIWYAVRKPFNGRPCLLNAACRMFTRRMYCGLKAWK